MEYKTFSTYWHEVTVNVSGKEKTGYIHKNHIKNAENVTFRGVAKKEITYIRTSNSTTSTPLTTVPIGTILDYQIYNAHWYQVTLNVSGTKETGFVHKKHVENARINQEEIKGIAKNRTTYIRTRPSTKADALTTYPAGTVLTYKTFSTYWYEISAQVNGKTRTGYVHRKHVEPRKVVFIDAGHCGSDPGAVANGIREKELNLDIAKRVQKQLESEGYLVVMSRTGDAYLSLSDRVNHAENVKADIFVSIHGNAASSSANGIETYWYGKYEPEKSRELAEQIQKELIKETKANNRGAMGSVNGTGHGSGNFHVIRESEMPSTLVEVGFITNRNEASRLKQSSYLNKITKGIVNGIKGFFKVFS